MPSLKKILVIRNDKLGDFMLSLPTFALLKQALPGTLIHALLPDYTRDIALASGVIDEVIHDPGPTGNTATQQQLQHILQQQSYDAALTLYSTTRIGWQLWRAKIPYRLAPATKFAQLFYNHRLTQKRSQSTKPEYVYNLDLGQQLLNDWNIQHRVTPTPPYLHFDPTEISALRQTFIDQYKIPSDQPLVFLHPGSGGSAVNLSLSQYARLAHQLYRHKSITFVLSAGPTEIEVVNGLAAMLKAINPVIYISRQGLVNFAKHLAFADLFIGGSTGPLHIAGALDRPTVGFYPRRRSATALRWQTLNSPERRLAFSPPDTSGSEAMSAIDVEQCANQIITTYF